MIPQVTKNNMWPFRKKKDEKKKIIDKVLMGAVIGGAIGSVVGASLPEKDREEIKKAAKRAKTESGKIVSKIGAFFRKSETEEEKKKIPHEEI